MLLQKEIEREKEKERIFFFFFLLYSLLSSVSNPYFLFSLCFRRAQKIELGVAAVVASLPHQVSLFFIYLFIF
jgi:hypothetical protein